MPLCRCVETCTVNIEGRRVFVEEGFEHVFKKCPKHFIEISKKEQQDLISAAKAEASNLSKDMVDAIALEIAKGEKLLAKLREARKSFGAKLGATTPEAPKPKTSAKD